MHIFIISLFVFLILSSSKYEKRSKFYDVQGRVKSASSERDG